ncbi:hypothetical protein [Idiomarina sp. HP20-50]|uniref:tetratricopeptide repeat protein n=1 Tax=Idiomarina sp. HP20-50 TaxID=3070813 RepID=UPI00294AF88C|nr:hypothetical protein [Idiomarina sp. HP20-50]MDV6316424.1 hypothetical protein [Idiomarina sp. HP20-50]
MKPMTVILTSMTLALMVYLSPVAAEEASQLLTVQQRWAEVNYTLEGDEQLNAFEELSKQAENWVKQEPENAEAHIWLGIIKSTQAGAEGGLSALGLAKEARKHLERALQLEPDALGGSAYASLGTLYYKVPGWPFGFGDDDKASELLQQALKINPDGIDPNYFYADYLFEQEQYQKAKAHAQRALNAEVRAQRPLADAERRKEVHALLDKINRELKG